ncbi:V-type ATP synthase subunit B [Streptomyces pluripotens]|uniref:V-type ATP synthase beta chain n=1 Tax=Streptomyces pluripotens TaxID=1355015 RepID=A0A221NSD1_9ACTN|nr:MULTISPECIES: V-type ATP synthase subunit B [Streptomyces]ARP68628.1 V-type ATP synthase subunit B [Streptomyces pluripotens]ASN22889.1 V-type ATP synthase subunit B [Streptomyces pluripotens]MCH0559283.1 V-type ATP synthase subunit B [Streptomyces sp. MUM 16J]
MSRSTGLGRAGPVEYTGVRELHGPLVVVGGVSGVGWDEFATIILDSGELRHGLVLEVDRDLAVVQVLEDTAGMDRTSTRVAFSGAPLRVPVGTGWLGRVCNGRGEPTDGGPPVLGGTYAAVGGAPINPLRREPPDEAVLTGVTAVDVLTTVVRGQKLPVFSAAGLPHLDLAVQIAAQATCGEEAFAVVFAGMGLTHADAAFVRSGLAKRSAARELVLLLNTADDPVIERLLTPRLALTVAEHLAFTQGRHVLVVMADMTAYSEALREVSAARGEIPARRAYPGYLYSDLASLYERCGRIRGRPGSVTVLPVLTMPAGDITHPVPDLTGYITEGQIVLSAEVYATGVYPPVDPLASLSRLMRRGTGAGRTRADHPDVAAQLIAALARSRQVRELADLIGRSALSPADLRHLDMEEAFRQRFLAQGRDENRSLEDSLDRAWEVLLTLPRGHLGMLPAELLDAHGVPSRAGPKEPEEPEPGGEETGEGTGEEEARQRRTQGTGTDSKGTDGKGTPP